MPKKPKDGPLTLADMPVHVQLIVGACRGGKTLCRGYRPRVVGETEEVVTYWLEPGGKRVGSISARRAIVHGFLAPLDPGPLGDGNAQTYGPAHE